MDRAPKRSKRLAEKRRRAGGRSHEMSVGEALDADTHEVDATNLAEARAMDSARKAAARREKQTPRVKNKHGKKKHSHRSKRKTKKQSRKQEKPPRHERERSRRELQEGLRTDPRTNRRRSFADEDDALAATEFYMGDSIDEGTDDDKPPPLDGSSEEKQYSDEGAGAAAAAEGASVIATPAHERAVATPGDDNFIKGSDESDTPASGGQITDGDWEPDEIHESETYDSDYARRHALVVSWRRVFRIAGPEMTVTQAVQDSALHDLQRFKVESFVDWGFANDGTVVFKVHWRGFTEDEDTWEPMAQLDDDVEVLVGKFVEETDNPDLTQALLQVRARRRSRTATARRQTDRLAGRTYANAAARATTPAVGPNVTDQPAVTATTDPINDTRASRAGRRSRRARARQALASDAASAVNDTTAASDAARDDRARRRASRRR